MTSISSAGSGPGSAARSAAPANTPPMAPRGAPPARATPGRAAPGRTTPARVSRGRAAAPKPLVSAKPSLVTALSKAKALVSGKQKAAGRAAPPVRRVAQTKAPARGAGR